MSSKAIIAATQSLFTSSTQVPIEYPAAQKHVIPFGMDFSWLELTPAIALKSKNIQSQARGRFIVFALGRHVEYKGFDVLIRAIQQTSANLLLGGEGPLTKKLKKLALQLGLSDRVSFPGRLTKAEVAAHYHACDVFCLPSVTTNEAFGIVQIEAMACGKPVICTQLNNGVNEINPHLETGITVPASQPIAIANAINELYYNINLRKKIIAHVKIYAKNNFSIEQMHNRHIAIYESLI